MARSVADIIAKRANGTESVARCIWKPSHRRRATASAYGFGCRVEYSYRKMPDDDENLLASVSRQFRSVPLRRTACFARRTALAPLLLKQQRVLQSSDRLGCTAPGEIGLKTQRLFVLSDRLRYPAHAREGKS